MQRKGYRSYVVLILFLFGCLNLPLPMIEPFQTGIIRLISPLWKKISLVRLSFSSFSLPLQDQRKIIEEKILQLEAENGALSRQNEQLKQRIFSKDQMESHFKQLEKHTNMRLELELYALAAQVVYRQPTSWSSSIWINVGEHDNEAIGFPVVNGNSPVLSGKYLIGLVEFVGKKQSRVRLLTDSSLVISVRAVRGAEQHREMLYLIDHLAVGLAINKEGLLATAEQQDLIEKLGILYKKLQSKVGDKYLAKGELFGMSAPLWRSRSSSLKGIGFNYDFEDIKGPARELRTGKPYGHLFQASGVALIQEGDLLVTTGMDGFFPPDLPVAFVTKVDPLKEGATSFSIEAQLCTTKIDDLASVIVLPALEVFLEKKS